MKILSRKSRLALEQVKEVMSLFPEVAYEVIKTDSLGDKNKDISLIENNITDIFTKELDIALLDGKGDLAIHSAKDLPTPLPEGLAVAALLEAFDRTDALVSMGNIKLADLPVGAKIGTSSITRQEQILAIRPDLEIKSLRGSIEERIDLVDKGEVDAVIVATCALKRLSLEDRIAEILSIKTHDLQGNIAIVTRNDREDIKEIFGSFDIRKKYGKVFLIGAGPGDEKLLTLKADEVLQNADVILYDDLVNNNIMEKYNAEKIYVGKRKHDHSKEQEEINRIIYETAVSGKNTARMKGGDPFIFGRGGEEIRYLEDRLVQVEVVPGITSAIAAAASCGIPLTERGLSSSVCFCTGHHVINMNVPETDTLVFYMSASTLQPLVKKILDSGRDKDTPVAIIYKASLDGQELMISTLQEIIDNKIKGKSPSIVITGDVVRRRNPGVDIAGSKSVLVTGTYPDRYRSLGNVIHAPMIEIRSLSSYEELDKEIEIIRTYDWILFTSRYAVKYFFERLFALGKDTRDLAGCGIASIGRITNKKLNEYGVKSDIYPEKDESSYGVIELFKDEGIKGKKILMPRSGLALGILPEGLRDIGNDVTTVVAYKNELPADCRKVDLKDVKEIVFSSPSCVKNFKKIYGDIPDSISCISTGKVTTKAIKEYFQDAKIKELSYR